MGWADSRPEATAWYWDSAYDPHRDVLLATVDTVAPRFGSVLEVGSHCGPNLRRLRERFGPYFRYVGLDVNVRAVIDGTAKAVGDERAEFQVGEAPQDLTTFPSASVDLVISSGALMCLAAGALTLTLDEMRRIARLAVICQEPQGHGEWLDGKGWAHEYPPWVVTC